MIFPVYTYFTMLSISNKSYKKTRPYIKRHMHYLEMQNAVVQKIQNVHSHHTNCL